jgi:hypothetical protein
MEAIVAQPLRGELFHVRRGHTTPERAELPETNIVNKTDIRRALGTAHNLREVAESES